MRWLRLYEDVINDPKVLKLPEATRWHWVALLCVASKNGGTLPLLDDIAIQLRVTTGKATQILAALVKGGLLDKTETGFAPHNWNGRQYKTDKDDKTNATRQQRYRDKKKHADNAVTADDSNGVTPVTVKRPESETDTERDRIVDARERDGAALTVGSKALVDAFWKAIGIKAPLGVPVEYYGADHRAIDWEKAGWTVDLVDAEARRVGPGKPLSYYEKVFATAFAKLQAPLPVVEVRQAETLTVIHGTSQNRSGGSLHAVLDRELAAIEAEERADLALSESPVRRISN